MATPFQKLVEKVLNDHNFRQQFLNNPVEAYKSLGFPVTPQVEQALSHLDIKSITALAVAMQAPTPPLNAGHAPQPAAATIT